MRISGLDWDEYRIEHIALHNVEPDEVWEICEDPLHLARRQGRNRFRLYGRTEQGRYLYERFIVQTRHGERYDRWRKTKFQEIAEMEKLQVPEFKTYEEEAAWWENFDTADYMEDDGEWFRFETPKRRAIRVAILPEVADELMQRARAQGVAVETLVNTLLIERMRESAVTS